MEEYFVDYLVDHYMFYLIDIDESGGFYSIETYRVKTAFYPRKTIQKEINGQIYIIPEAYHSQGKHFNSIEKLVKWLDGQPYVAKKFFMKSVFGDK